MTFLAWYASGLVFYWLGNLIVQIFYLCEGDKVEVMDVTELKKEMVASLIIAIIGPFCIVFIPQSVWIVITENQRRKRVAKLFEGG